jgi:hypothetical protein
MEVSRNPSPYFLELFVAKLAGCATSTDYAETPRQGVV